MILKKRLKLKLNLKEFTMPTRKSPEEIQAAKDAEQASLAMLKSKGFNEVEKPLPLPQDMTGPATVQEPVETPIDVAIESAKEAPVAPQPVLVESEVKPEMTLSSNYYPIDMDTLPTRGKFYGGKQIYIRNFKVLEVKKLATITKANAEDAVNKVLRDCIKGVDWETVVSYDKIALMFFIRVNTFPDPRYKIGYSCYNEIDTRDSEGDLIMDEKTGLPKQHKCDHEGELHFTAGDLTINKLPEDFESTEMFFEVNDNDKVEWRFPTVGDEVGMEKEVEEAIMELRNAEVDEDDIDKEMLQIAYLIKSINGQPQTLLEKYLFIIDDSMTPQDSIKFIHEINSRFDIGIDTDVTDTCKKCGGSVSVSVMFSSEFFFPRYKK
jgi:hypothetical protein